MYMYFVASMCLPSDPMLHVWEVSPHSEEILFLLSSFCLATPPSLMVSTKDRLCVVCNNPDLSSYTLEMFSIENRGTTVVLHYNLGVTNVCIFTFASK